MGESPAGVVAAVSVALSRKSLFAAAALRPWMARMFVPLRSCGMNAVTSTVSATMAVASGVSAVAAAVPLIVMGALRDAMRVPLR